MLTCRTYVVVTENDVCLEKHQYHNDLKEIQRKFAVSIIKDIEYYTSKKRV
jgi:hypothetical protein